jgi:pimeloyl-ACP methyl ester carboxylesterase
MTAPEWAGFVQLGGVQEFVKLTGQVTGAATVRVDLPNARTFGLTMTLAGHGDPGLSGDDGHGGGAGRGGGHGGNPGDGHHPAGGGSPGEGGEEITGRLALPASSVLTAAQACLAGRCDGQVFAGQVTAGDQAGSFELRQVAIWDLPGYRGLSAAYEVAGGRRISIHVNPDDWVGTPIMFYSERDRLVRLYPDVTGRLVSEEAEVLMLTADRRGIESLGRLGRADPPAPVTRLAAWSEQDVVTVGPAGTLAGTLLQPPGPGPHPAIVLIHGAAGGLRDVYRAYAEHFVRAGLAALVYDKRGYGGSAGGDGDPSFHDKSLDAEAWVDYLQARPDIRAGRVGVWGFSNGTWVAPLVAARRPDVAFLAVIGATGTTPVETEIHRRVFDLREQGVPEDQVEQVGQLWRLVYDLLRSRQPSPDQAQRYDRLAARVRASRELAGVTLQDYAIAEPLLGLVPPFRSYQEIVDRLPDWPVSDAWTCDPADSYRVIGVPVLFLVGDQDSNLPGLHSAQRASRALRDAGNHDATVVVFPNTGHMMNAVEVGSDTGMTSEEAGYRYHHFRFAGGFTGIVRSWAASRAAE